MPPRHVALKPVWLKLFYAGLVLFSLKLCLAGSPHSPTVNTTYYPPNSSLQIAWPRDIYLSPGLNLVGCPWFLDDHRIAVLFPRMPVGTTLTKLNHDGRTVAVSVFGRNGWSNPSITLKLGDGALLFNPLPQIILLSCNEATANYVASFELMNGYSLMGGMNVYFNPPQIDAVPESSVTNNPNNPVLIIMPLGLYFDPQDGDVVTTLNRWSHRLERHIYHVATGWDSVPWVHPDESFFVQTRHPRTLENYVLVIYRNSFPPFPPLPPPTPVTLRRN